MGRKARPVYMANRVAKGLKPRPQVARKSPCIPRQVQTPSAHWCQLNVKASLEPDFRYCLVVSFVSFPVSDWECRPRGFALRLAAEPQLKSISSLWLETRFENGFS
ncbi:hypothetical protein LC613_32690 [Nostoc sphaeroides CHAB 2801]|uniref:hypothetical protein n=1 Tax=Nostoc sphaeroides TaxID=446679 RepID=UPI001E30EBCD|nr:hypothetical protein [Nostoc sphaeroides]MCC5632392.1 hypothetical protein [Nostoc sphaeroides CHAB 2801]